jgi:hypothetical protein
MKTNDLKLFERYYNGEMDSTEKAAFEKSLTEDLELNASYHEYLSIYEAIGDKETMDLRIKLREIREQHARKKKGRDFLDQGNNWLWMAALITVIISFSIITSIIISRQHDKEQFASEFIIPEYKEMSDFDRELMKFGMRNMEFKLESPVDSIFLNRKNPITFKWTVNSSNPLIIELIDYKGRIVFSTVDPVGSPYKINKPLPGGIMVYRFRTEKETYHLGFLYLR